MKLIAVDGNSLMYRAYFALPNMTSRSGVPTGAVYGFLSMLINLMAKRPEYMLVAFDMPGGTFRHESYELYKAGRKPTPDELKMQMPIVKKLLADMGVTVCECPGYEADDILGTLASAAQSAGVDTLIVTGDRDALQLIDDRTRVLLTKRGVSETLELDEAALAEHFGVTPAQVVELKALMGDSSDNIPGIPGVGEKTALALLSKYGTAENALAHASEEKGALRRKLEEHGDSARLSRELATICRSAPVELALEDCAFDVRGVRGAIPYMTQLELRSLIRRIETEFAAESTAAARVVTAERGESRTLKSEADVLAFADAVRARGVIAVSLKPEVTFAADERTAYVCENSGGLLGSVDGERALELLAPVFGDARVRKLAFDSKKLMHALDAYGAELNGPVFDAMIVDYLLHAIKPAASLEALAQGELSHDAPTDARALFALELPLTAELELKGLKALYDEMELPLVRVLYSMEKAGFRIDEEVLQRLGEEFSLQAGELMNRIYELTGEQFSILSPKQLGHILFDKLGLPPIRKTKTGYSTDSDTLEALADKHPIVPLITQYRFISKLKSTYIDGMGGLVDAGTKRIHTSFNQAITATGRISSTEPNLQNIPVRTAQGREIRRAFIAREGSVLVGADYSQIELRVLAHMSADERLIAAFASGEDIHRKTASEVFSVPFDEVTQEQRSAAKAVNFGIVYGISDFGLAQNLSIPRYRAAEYIRRYLERYSGVNRYMRESVAEAKRGGCAVTLFGRRRDLPELSSSNYNTRAFGERVAMNMPIQGTAADIIKLAMVRVYDELAAGGFGARLVLQVHDELIIECPVEEVSAVSELLRRCMESACELRVPLVAQVSSGKSWYDAK
ncbi:MAG: DNA polymerase I [Clostridia bacterium]|nr:DNA polymerase I [Clostridia bacterium]